MDQYNTRRKELERLMEMYSEYCASEVPPETSQQRHMSKQQMPPLHPKCNKLLIEKQSLKMFSKGGNR